METEKKVILDIEVRGDKTVKSLKEEIKNLRDMLLNVEKGSEDYNKVLNQLIADEKELTSVMQVGKKEVNAAAGSYNALSQEMSALKRVWKEVTDEASRNEIGSRINDINNQLKDMDASIGVFSRNVGDYTNSIVDASRLIFENFEQISPTIGGIGGQIVAIIPLIQNTVKAATKGLKGIKAALAGTGVGALVVALGLLIQNWDKLTAAIRKFIPSIKASDEATKSQVETNEKLLEANSAATHEMEFQARIMEAQGSATTEIIKFKKKETEAILLNTQAQISETQAKIDSINAHSKWYRFWHGENKQLKELEESMKSLKGEEQNLTAIIKKLGEDITVEGIKISKASKTTVESVEKDAQKIEEILERLGLYGKKGEELINAQFDKRKEDLKKQFEEEKALFEKNGQDTTTLTAEYVTNTLKLEDERYAAIQELKEKEVQSTVDAMLEQALAVETGAEEVLDAEQSAYMARDAAHAAFLEGQKQKEKEAINERIGYYMKFADALQNLLGGIADGWETSIQAQLDAGKISEEAAEEQFENVKAIQTAQAVINTIAGAVGAFMQATATIPFPYGQIVGGIAAAAATAAGMAQIAKIQSTTIGSKSVSTQFATNASVAPQAEYTPNYVSNVTGANEMEVLSNAITQQPIRAFVVESDITKSQNRVKQRNQESTF